MQPSSIPLLLLCSRRGPHSPPRRLRGGGHLDIREREQLHHALPPRLGRIGSPYLCEGKFTPLTQSIEHMVGVIYTASMAGGGAAP